MNTVLTILALAGIAAAAWHFVRAAFRFLRHGATGYWTEEMARTHARRGDVTSYQEAQRDSSAARLWKRRTGLIALGWLALLVAPSFSAWARPIYAAFAALWLLPLVGSGRDRRASGGAAAPPGSGDPWGAG